MSFKTIEWQEGKVRIIDQTKLPFEVSYLDILTPEEMAEAIRSLRIRGAPALGVAAAYGVVLAASRAEKRPKGLKRAMEEAIELLASTRPTAVNLFWALKRMRRLIEEKSQGGDTRMGELLLEEALAIQREEEEVSRRIGVNGEQLIPDRATVLTHCNAGALATPGWGTALGVIYAARAKGKELRVIATETRPLLQGARLTAWELKENGVEVTLIVDGAAGLFMQRGEVDLVLVGADRVVRNGDVANKVGTYPLSVLARENGVPFYVAAPLSTFDLSLRTGREIPIEERAVEEVVALLGRRLAPEGIRVKNPAFDLTPAENISGIITEVGVLAPPLEEAISRLSLQATAD